MDPERLLELVAEGEGQTLEFKQSLSSSAQREARQSLVAFANTDGGRVLFGVRDDGRVTGVQVGNNTLENLANRLRQHTYPSLPIAIEQVEDDKGRTVLIVEVPKDKPPLIGVYMSSDRPIPLDREVEADRLQAYRRVGRTNQKEDFMRLRGSLLSDPRLRLTFRDAGQYSDRPDSIYFSGTVWVEENSGSAHRITFECAPPLCGSKTSLDDLPFPSQRHEASLADFRTVREMVTQARFEYSCEDLHKSLPVEITLHAVYMDDWGLAWRSSRAMRVYSYKDSDGEFVDLLDQGKFRRRITTFPPKEHGES